MLLQLAEFLLRCGGGHLFRLPGRVGLSLAIDRS
jgi:hypothetical protein